MPDEVIEKLRAEVPQNPLTPSYCFTSSDYQESQLPHASPKFVTACGCDLLSGQLHAPTALLLLVLILLVVFMPLLKAIV